MIDYNYFLNQLGVKLQLPENKYEELRKNYIALTEYIDNKHILADDEGEMYVQGSFAIDTAIIPLKGNDVDVDMVARFSDLWFPGLQVQPFFDKLINVFQEGRYSNIFEEHKSVIRINYSNDYHFDIMPVLKRDESPKNEHIKGVHIDRNKKTWTDRAPKLFKEWYDEKATYYFYGRSFYLSDAMMNLREMDVQDMPKPSYYNDKPPLTRVIQIIKRARDSFFYNYKDSIPQSIVLTTMIANIYNNEKKIKDFLIRVSSYFYDLAANGKQFTLFNPVNKYEEFTEKWKINPEYYTNFFKFAFWLYYKLINLLSTDNKKHFIKHLEDLFGIKTANQLQNNTQFLGFVWDDVFWKPGSVLSQDKLIEDEYILNLQHPIQLCCNIIPDGQYPNRKQRRYLSRIYRNDAILHHQKLKFSIEKIDIPMPYSIFWKVRNLVENESKYNQIRGKISSGTKEIEEHSDFNGNHYVECYIIKNNEVVGMDRINVPINE